MGPAFQPGSPHRLAAVVALVFISLVGGVALVLAPRGAATSPAAAAQSCIAQTSDGRPAPIVYRPTSLSGHAPAPLVIGLHAGGGTPAGFEAASGFDRVAGEHGFVVAYLGSADPEIPWRPPADIRYIGSVIDQLTSPGNPCGPIDPRRVYVTGFSLGAIETFKVACELSSKVAAVAPVSQALLLSVPCNLSRPVSELTIVGSNDRVPYNPAPNLPEWSTSQTTARWRRIDGCSSRAQTATVGPADQTTWNQCNDGSTVGLYIIQGGVHAWPGAPQAPGTDAQFDAAEAIWSFFAAHTRASKAASAAVSSVGVTPGRTRYIHVAFSMSDAPVKDPGNSYYRPNTLQLQLHRAGGHTVASHRFVLTPGQAAIRLAVPPGVRKGRYALKLTFTDTYGRRMTAVRAVSLPQPR